jgi:hypothetical protein
MDTSKLLIDPDPMWADASDAPLERKATSETLTGSVIFALIGAASLEIGL